MSKTEKRKLGDLGEDIASRFYVKRGYTILDRNYLRPWGEIDLVLKKTKTLYFVEVKTVSREPGKSMYRPEENVHHSKLKRLHRAIQTYVVEKKVGEAEWQIDVACVYIDRPSKKAHVELIENVIL